MHYFKLIWFTFSINLHPLDFYSILSSLTLTVPSEKCQSFGSPGTGLFYGPRGWTMTALTQIGLSHSRTSEEPTLPFVAILSFVLTRAFCCPHGNLVQEAGSAPPRSAQSSNIRSPWRTLTTQTLARPAMGIKGKAGPCRGRTALRNCMV